VADHETAIGIGTPRVGGASKGTASLLLEAMRPRHWPKNAFVLGGLVFSGEALEPGTQLTAWAVLGAFCLASSAAYLLNDVVDAETDRHNPRTAARPIARGDLSKRAALLAAASLAAAAIGTTAVINWPTLAVLCGFFALQLAYTYRLKHVLFVDIMAISAGFVLRAYAGLVSIEVEISSWLLLCTGLVSLFLALVKRRGEVVVLGGTTHPQRPVLEGYSVGLLDELIAVVTPSTLVAYSLYAVLGAETDTMLLTVPFVLYGIFRVLFLIHHRSVVPEEPATLIWEDRPLFASIVLWGLCAGVIAVASA
jgi:4-hydroxybenzoate polyprenyltransferase